MDNFQEFYPQNIEDTQSQTPHANDFELSALDELIRLLDRNAIFVINASDLVLYFNRLNQKTLAQIIVV